VDGRRLIREIASRRCALARVRREELSHPLVLLCCDVSGSCSAVCNETLAAAVAVAEALPHVVIVRHSNGYVIDMLGERAPRLLAREESIAAVVSRIREPI